MNEPPLPIKDPSSFNHRDSIALVERKALLAHQHSVRGLDDGSNVIVIACTAAICDRVQQLVDAIDRLREHMR